MTHNQGTKEQILKAMDWRYATQVFDTTKKVTNEDLHTILEAARLSPSSIGIEAWKFLVIRNPELRAKVGTQPKMTQASHLILITYRTDVFEHITQERLERTAKIQHQKVEELDGLKKTLENGIIPKHENGTLEAWVRAQAYIPLGIMIETASLLGIDNGPMEGFDPAVVDELLGLKEKNLKSLTMLALGYRGEDPAALRPKVRREFDDVVEFID
jgi:nitroreductase